MEVFIYVNKKSYPITWILETPNFTFWVLSEFSWLFFYFIFSHLPISRFISTSSCLCPQYTFIHNLKAKRLLAFKEFSPSKTCKSIFIICFCYIDMWMHWEEPGSKVVLASRDFLESEHVISDNSVNILMHYLITL